MRLVALALALLLALPGVDGAAPDLLADAIRKVGENFDRWAFTQTTIERNDKGEVIHASVFRFDPSRPYAEQYTPQVIDDKEPNAFQRLRYRLLGESRARQIERASDQGTDYVHKTVGELMDLDNTRVIADAPRSVTFEVPFKKEGNRRFPPEKFFVEAKVSKALRAFESISAELRSPWRAQLLVKIKSGAGYIEFATVDPKYPPVIASLRGGGQGSILLVPLARTYEETRGDFKRVRPYDERFSVQIGPLKAIDF
jgi:hypothetical protein